MRTKREQAEHLLQYYMRHAWEAAGLTWHGDNDAETGLIVDSIIEAVTDRDPAQAQERRYVSTGDRYDERRVILIPRSDGTATVYEGGPSITAPVFDGPAYAARSYAEDRHKDYTGQGWVTVQA